MASPYVGQIISVGFNWSPVGWAACNGQALPIVEYEALFTLIGTTYGGDGQATFKVPNLNGSVPIGMGQGTGLSPYSLGQAGGVEEVTLTVNQIAQHNHSINFSSNPATNTAPTTNIAIGAGVTSQLYGLYAPGPGTQALGPATITNSQSGAQPHENRQPYQVLNYIICTQGLFPPRP
ncbi:MAG TPA: tail fiber protein [Reyranella sp.]|nr:tail fiber protein [Reyranella sp.]